MTFHEAHVLLVNSLARIFGGLALVAGSFFLVGAYAIEGDLDGVGVGLLLIAIGVAVFVAKPVTVETITSIRRRRVVSINDCLAPLLPVAIDSTSRSRPVDNDPRSGAASGRFSERNPAARGHSLSLEPRSQSTDSGH
jgi:hypothetical protein